MERGRESNNLLPRGRSADWAVRPCGRRLGNGWKGACILGARASRPRGAWRRKMAEMPMFSVISHPAARLEAAPPTHCALHGEGRASARPPWNFSNDWKTFFQWLEKICQTIPTISDNYWERNCRNCFSGLSELSSGFHSAGSGGGVSALRMRMNGFSRSGRSCALACHRSSMSHSPSLAEIGTVWKERDWKTGRR